MTMQQVVRTQATLTRVGKRLSAADRARRGVGAQDDAETRRILSAGVMARWAMDQEHPPTAEDMAQWRAWPEWQQ